jgi:hypothetical protein
VDYRSLFSVFQRDRLFLPTPLLLPSGLMSSDSGNFTITVTADRSLVETGAIESVHIAFRDRNGDERTPARDSPAGHANTSSNVKKEPDTDMWSADKAQTGSGSEYCLTL